MAPLVELCGVRKYYDGREVLAIDHLAIERGRLYCVMGSNGAGKSTLLSIIALLTPPTEGHIYWEGKVVGSIKKGRGKGVTLVGQHPYLFNTTVRDNVLYGLRGRGLSKQQREKRMRACLEMVGLSGFEKKRARGLSGGEVQRVAIARALACEPTLLLLDEPMASVDREGNKKLETLLKEVHSSQGLTIMITTHDIGQAHRLADDVIYLEGGRIVPTPPLENLFKGVVVGVEEGLAIFDTGRMMITVSAAHKDISRIAISPDDIILSYEPLEGSARNCLAGVIRQVTDDRGAVGLIVEAGERLYVRVTKRSFVEMGLGLGSRVYVTFKSSAVQAF